MNEYCTVWYNTIWYNNRVLRRFEYFEDLGWYFYLCHILFLFLSCINNIRLCGKYIDKKIKWLGWQGSNLRPPDPNSGVLSTELHPSNLLI